MILNDLTAQPETDPTHLITRRDGLNATELIIAATAHLDFFSWLESNPSNLNNICHRFQLKERPTDVMLTLFCSLGLCSRDEEGVFSNTKLASEHMTVEAPFSLVPFYNTHRDRPDVDAFYKVLKTDEPANWSPKGNLDWTRAMEDETFAEQFTAGMDSRGAFFAPAIARNFDFSQYDSILDIAAGSGIYVSAIKAKHPLIKAALLEKPPVNMVAAKALEKRNLTGEVEVYAGDMFDYIPEGYDVHLYSHVLHDWDVPQNRKLIKNSYYSLNPGGIIMIHDAHLNTEKNGPLSVAEYSALLLFLTYGKCYSEKEIIDLLEEQGFKNCQFRKTAGNRSIIWGQKVV